MEMSYASGGGACVVVIATYWIYRFLEWIWLRPKRLEKRLREQGFKGNPYSIFAQDQKRSAALIRLAKTRPISLHDDVKNRVVPHLLQPIQTHGKKSFMWVGRSPRIFITEPEQIRDVLIKYHTFHKNHHDFDPITKALFNGISSLEGEPWAKRKKLIRTAFHFEKLKLMLPAFYLACSDMVNKWDKKVSPEGTADFDVWHDIEMLTADVISRTLFGNSYEENHKIFDLMKEIVDLVIQVVRSVYIPGWRFLPTKRNRRLRKIDKEVAAAVTEIMNKKLKAMKAGETKSDDFLGILLECNMNEIKEQGSKSVGMTTREIIGECKLFYSAGLDSTSALLLWTMVLLCKHPEWQARAREEVLQVLGDKKPDYDLINSLKIVTMILYEVLRLYPPVVELTKVAHEDTKLGGVFIPEGVQVMISQMLLHHDSKIWGDDVMEFKPERFSDGIFNATKSQGSFFPFSLGPRMCIGQNFALLEAKMALALILPRFSFELSPSYVHAPFTIITLQPQFGARFILHKL